MDDPTDSELCERVRDGDRPAAAVLIERHRMLVIGVVRSMAPFPGTVDYDDLISAGLIGILRAAKCYQSNRGTKFSTWAYPAVRWSILRELGEASDPAMRETDLILQSELDDELGLAALPAPESLEDGPQPSLLVGLDLEQEQLIRMTYGIDSPIYSQREIAKRMGYGRSTVRKRLAEALTALRRSLDGVAARPPGNKRD